MKSDIHSFYRTVVFYDTSANKFFKVGSIIKAEREIESEGKVYPYVTFDISSKLHPHYTGKQKIFDNKGSAACFQKRFGHFIGVKRGQNAST